jgi:hypothetical protein
VALFSFCRNLYLLTLTISRSPYEILIYFLQLQTKAGEERMGEYYKARKTRPFTLLALCLQVKNVRIFVQDTVSDMLFEYCTEICIGNPLVNIGGIDPKTVD